MGLDNDSTGHQFTHFPTQKLPYLHTEFDSLVIFRGQVYSVRQHEEPQNKNPIETLDFYFHNFYGDGEPSSRLSILKQKTPPSYSVAPVCHPDPLTTASNCRFAHISDGHDDGSTLI